MEIKRIYLVQCEVGGGTCANFPPEALGGIVECYVPSDSEYEARELAVACLELDGYDVREVEEPIEVTYEALESSDPEELSEVLDIIRDAVMSSQVMYGPFRVWTSDGE